ncbi:hypothetical protein [Salinibacterium sp. ZJ450]|uniref:hypothetical protein n=1 Tax=Salinibacterium sp. ZJ450 TaxID=2708338 RepID=UPI00142114A8|nr:hypothetical protein [Salinibacterium sp. ZJ450]
MVLLSTEQHERRARQLLHELDRGTPRDRSDVAAWVRLVEELLAELDRIQSGLGQYAWILAAAAGLDPQLDMSRVYPVRRLAVEDALNTMVRRSAWLQEDERRAPR